MARINLLPWREEFRQEKKKEFLTQIVGVGVLAGVVAFAWILSVDNAIDNQAARNERLKVEISMLEEQVKEIQQLRDKREQLISRMQVIQDLQGTRPTIVRYFDELSRAVPDGVFVVSITREGAVITLKGIAESSPRVSDFMRRLNSSDWFDDPSLKGVKADKKFGDGAVEFTLSLTTVLPKSTDEESDNG